MTFDQIFLFALLGAIFVMLVWDKVRYDLVAFAGLVVAVFAGVVPVEDAFSGFGNQAVVIVALVLIVSRALQSAGAVELIARCIVSSDRSLPMHIGVMAGVGAALSSVMNNVAALAMLMNLDMEAARKAKRAASLSLMPLAFATVLGGVITLIGTPPNIVISEIRAREVGEPFAIFDFTPVGLICAVAGVLYIALIGWRLIPERAGTAGAEGDSEHFVVEAKVPETSKAIDQTPRDLYELADKNDVTILGLVRRGKRLVGFAAAEPIRKNDLLVLEGNTKSIEAFIGAIGLSAHGQDKHGGLTGESMILIEAVVPKEARLAGRSAYDLRLLNRRGVSLIGVSRQGKRFRDRVQHLAIQPGDLVLLLGPEPRATQVAEWLGVWPIEQGRHAVLQRQKALLAIGFFAAAILAAVIGIAPLAVTLAAAVIFYAAFKIIGPREVYEAIDWPVIVLLAALIPIITERNSPFIALCTDDRNPLDIAEHGHLDHMIRTAIAAGCEPLAVYRAASVSAARIFGLQDRGLVAPGQRADLVVMDDLAECRASMVISGGRVVSEDLFATRRAVAPVGRRSVRAPRVAPARLRATGKGKATPVIGVVPGRIITEHLTMDLPENGGYVAPDLDQDAIRLSIVERHGKNGNIANGFVNGFGLARGAIASTVGHDSHNICCVGIDTADMAIAINRLSEIEGGFVVVEDGRVTGELPLPVAGLMSLMRYEEVRDAMRDLRKAALALSSTLEEPFLQIAFLPLPVIPHLKITDRGLFDVDRFAFVEGNA